MAKRMSDVLGSAEEPAVTEPAGDTPEPIRLQPYESAYVGAFIFALGWCDGQGAAGSDAGPQAVVSLLVQSGLEVRYGDLLAGWAGCFFLLEFKRDEGELATEWKKKRRARMLRRLKECRSDDADFRNLGARGHFLAYGQTGAAPDLLFAKYGNLIRYPDPDKKDDTTPTEQAPPVSLKSIPLIKFIQVIRSGKKGWSSEELERYGKWMDQFDKGEGGIDEFTGVLVGISVKNEVLIYPYQGISMLMELAAHARAQPALKVDSTQQGGGIKPKL